MNTTAKGDLFEEESFHLIKSVIESGDLPISSKNAKIYKKPKYFSKKREKKIIFDLSIEVWADKAERYSILYLIECKDYSSKNVPIGDVELFANRVNDIAELNGKAIFIAKCPYPSTAIEYAKNTGMMLIEVKEDNSTKIILHRKHSNSTDYDSKIQKLLSYAFISHKVEGLEKLSKNQISNQVNNLLLNIDGAIFNEYRSLTLQQIVNYFENNFNLQFEFGFDLFKLFGDKLLGCFDLEKNIIFTDKTLLGKNNFMFVLAHELGHFSLHRGIKIDQEVYDNFKDSDYDIFEDRHILKNYRNWIEWQANCFASNFIMPEKSFRMQLMAYRKIQGIRNYETIYLDNQPQNFSDYQKTVKYLTNIFNVSYKSVEIRIEELNLINRKIPKNNYHDALRKSLDNFL